MNAIEEARKRGLAWAERMLVAKTDPLFVKTGKVSLLTAAMMTKDIRASGNTTRLAIERAFMDAAGQRHQQENRP